MLTSEYWQRKLQSAFEEKQAAVLMEVLTEVVRESQKELVKASDFSELKEIVRDLGVKMGGLAEAQARTEQRVEELAEAQKKTEQRLEELAAAQKRTEQRVEELAAAQKRTEQRVEELAEAQKRTEQRLEELAEAQKKTEQRLEELAEAQRQLAETQRKTEQELRELARQMGDVRTELGGLSRSVSYALENEAYRSLPAYLEKLGIELTERFIREEIEGEEINILGQGKKDGREIIIVGEAEVRLTSVNKIRQLERKAGVVQQRYPQKEVFKILVTHFARPAVIEKAREKGIAVVQSFEWL